MSWLIDLNVSPMARMFGPQVHWIEPLPFREFSGGEFGCEYVWKDRHGEDETVVRIKAGHSGWFQVPTRAPTIVRLLS